MKAVVAAFNQEKALVGAFSVITNLRMELFEPVLAPVKRRPGGELASRTSPGLAPAECGGRLHGVDRPEDGSEDSRRTGILLGCGVAGSCRRGDTRASVVASILASTVSILALISHCGLMLETLAHKNDTTAVTLMSNQSHDNRQDQEATTRWEHDHDSMLVMVSLLRSPSVMSGGHLWCIMGLEFNQ